MDPHCRFNSAKHKLTLKYFPKQSIVVQYSNVNKNGLTTKSYFLKNVKILFEERI